MNSFSWISLPPSDFLTGQNLVVNYECRWCLSAAAVTITSRDQFKPIKIGENFVATKRTHDTHSRCVSVVILTLPFTVHYSKR